MEPEEIVNSGRILLVEDDPVIVMYLDALLHRAGYGQVLSTNDPAEVFDLFTTWKPDILLLDFHFPGHNGAGVLENLKPLLDPDDYFPVLVMTGDYRSETRLQALLLGAKDFITKPFDPTELLLRIRILLDTRLLFHRCRGDQHVATAHSSGRSR